ncbi:hypothetical protein V8F20_006810 [Naviculisporaceae sp. PSN 640]
MGRSFAHWLLGDDPRKWLEPVKKPNPKDEVPTFHVEIVDRYGCKFQGGVPLGEVIDPKDKLLVITKEPFSQVMVLDKKGQEHWFVNKYNWTKHEKRVEKEFVLSRMTPSEMFEDNPKAIEKKRKDAILRGKGKEPEPLQRKNIIVNGRQKFPRVCVIDDYGVDHWADTSSDDKALVVIARKHQIYMKALNKHIEKMTVDELEKHTKNWQKLMEKEGVAIVKPADLDRVRATPKTEGSKEAPEKAATPGKTESSKKEAVQERAVNALANAIEKTVPSDKVQVKSSAQPERQHKAKEKVLSKTAAQPETAKEKVPAKTPTKPETARAKSPVPGHTQPEKKKAAKPQASPAPPPLPPKIPLDQPSGTQLVKRTARIDPSVPSPQPRAAIRPQMMVPTKQPIATRAASPNPRSTTPYPDDDFFGDQHMMNALHLDRRTPVPRSVSVGGLPYGQAPDPAQAAVWQALHNTNVYNPNVARQAPGYGAPLNIAAFQPARPNNTQHVRAYSGSQFLDPNRPPPSFHVEGTPDWKNQADRAKSQQSNPSSNIPGIKVTPPLSPPQKSAAPVTRKPTPARSPSPTPLARSDRQTSASQQAKTGSSPSSQTQKVKPVQVQQPAQPIAQKPAQKQSQSVPQQKPAQKPVQIQQKPAQVQQQKPAQVQQQKPAQVQQQKPVQVQQKPAQVQQQKPVSVQPKPAQVQQQKPVQVQQKPAQPVSIQPKTTAQVQQKPAQTQQPKPISIHPKTTAQAQLKPAEVQQKKPVQVQQQKPDSVQTKPISVQPKPTTRVQQKQVQVEPKPVQVQQPKPVQIQPKPAQVPPKPAQVQQPKPVSVQPKHVSIYPKTTTQVQQKPATVQPNTTAQVQQKPVQTQPKPVQVQPKPVSVQPKTTTQVQQKPVSVQPKPASIHPKTTTHVEKKPVQVQPKPTAQAQQKPVQPSVQSPIQQKPAQKPAQPVQHQKTAFTSQQKPAQKPAPVPAPAPAPAAASASSRKPVPAPSGMLSPVASTVSSASSSPGPRLPRAPRPPGWDQIPVWDGVNDSPAASEVGSITPAMRNASMISTITTAVTAALSAVASTGGFGYGGGDAMNPPNPNAYQQQQQQQQFGQHAQYQGQGQHQGQGDPYQGGHMPGSWAFSPAMESAPTPTPARSPNPKEKKKKQRSPAGPGHVCDRECHRNGCPAVVGDNAAFMVGTGYVPGQRPSGPC